MIKPLRIISIDGTRGAGKSSQISMLNRYFKGLGTKTMIIKAGHDVPSGIAAVAYAEEFLSNNPESLVILDGSIARMMVQDIVAGMPSMQILDKYKHLTHDYEALNHQYGVASFLMVMDNMEECNRRMTKQQALTGQSGSLIVDLTQEAEIVNGMKFFNNHITSKNIHFEVLSIEQNNTMIDVNKTIMEILINKFGLSKPKRDSNDW